MRDQNIDFIYLFVYYEALFAAIPLRTNLVFVGIGGETKVAPSHHLVPLMEPYNNVLH